MIRAVLDANVLISAFIRPAGPPGRILAELIERSAFELELSPQILDEFERCLEKPKLRRFIAASGEEIKRAVAFLGLLGDVVPGTYQVDAIPADPDDNKYLSAALEGRAHYVVSGDHHLLELREYQGVEIVTPRRFLALLART